MYVVFFKEPKVCAPYAFGEKPKVFQKAKLFGRSAVLSKKEVIEFLFKKFKT
jgi:hypothetical protein